jgi:hypothetical protein
MSAFDKVCAAVAFLLGVALLILGVFGLFAGCKAHFTLPPILGVLPAFVGWGIIRAIWVAWNVQPPQKPMIPRDDKPFS